MKINQELTTIARVMCLSEMNVLEGTDDCIVLYVSMLSLALLYVSDERIHVNVCVCVTLHRDIFFNLFNYFSFAVGHMNYSLCFF